MPIDSGSVQTKTLEISLSLLHHWGGVNDDIFRYHVNRDKNDFEVWIRDVIKDKELGREISRVKTKETLIRKINERVNDLKRIVKRHRTALDKKRRTKKAKKTARRVKVARKAKRVAKKGKHTKKSKRKKVKRVSRKKRR